MSGSHHRGSSLPSRDVPGEGPVQIPRIVLVDAMVVSDRRGLGRLLELARRRGTRLVIAPEVMRELEQAGIRVPEGFEEAQLVDEDEELIERLLRRTLGKDAVDR